MCTYCHVCLCVCLGVPLFDLRDICESRTINTSGSATEVRCAVSPGDDVRLSCAYDAYPLGTLSLMFGSTDVTTAMIENVDVENSTIVISNFDLKINGGTYECVARNTIRGVAGEATVRFILSGWYCILYCLCLCGYCCAIVGLLTYAFVLVLDLVIVNYL